MHEEEQEPNLSMMVIISYSSPEWMNFVNAWVKALKPYYIHPAMTFLPELILLLGGVDVRLPVTAASFSGTDADHNIQIKIQASDDVISSAAESLALNHNYAPIRYRFVPGTDGNTVGVFVFSAYGLRERLIPSLNDLKTQHPGFFERHQNSAGSLAIRLNEVLSRYSISAQDNDSIEETILALVQRSVFVKFMIYQQFILHFYNEKFLKDGSVRPALPADAIQTILDFLIAPAWDLRTELDTTISLFEDNPTDTSYTRICTTVPLNKIKYVEHYFNESVPGSAYSNPTQEPIPQKDNALLTVLNVKHSTLFRPKFLQRFEDVLYADESKKLAGYQRDTHADHIGTPDVPNTPERIRELEDVKSELFRRNSIFASYLDRIQDSLDPWLLQVKGKASDCVLIDSETDLLIGSADTDSNDTDHTEKRPRLS